MSDRFDVVRDADDLPCNDERVDCPYYAVTGDPCEALHEVDLSPPKFYVDGKEVDEATYNRERMFDR